ncbi:MAG: hypothetical protein WC047_05365 [Kiritimatiellales bacterium]
MKKWVLFAGLTAAVSVQAGNYSQDFNSASAGSTDLGDGSTITDSGTGFAQVYSNETWKALRLTQDGPSGSAMTGNYAFPDLDAGNTVSGFTASFDVLIKNDYNGTADGFSFNFGTLGALAYGGEEGMYSGSGSMLSIGWDTYNNGGSDPQSIEVFVNGVSAGNNTAVPPVIASSLSGPFQSVFINWDANGLDVTYGGTAVFTDLDISGFTPLTGAQFAFAARTGGENEDVFIDNVNINTIPEPAGAALIAAIVAAAFFIRRRCID